MNMKNEYTIIAVENGYTIDKEEQISSDPFPEYNNTKYVFINVDSALAWLKDNI